MDFSELARGATNSGAKWVKLRTKEDGSVQGAVLSYELRDRTDMDGNPVKVRGKETIRQEGILTLMVPLAERENLDDEGIRKLACNESMRDAIAQAIAASRKATGEEPKEGDTLKIAVAQDPPTPMSQAQYVARWTAIKPTIDISEF
jgi:hypothetical protein